MKNNEVLEKVEEQINCILEEGLGQENSINKLYKLVDIHKDLKNEEYWKEKMNMRYSEGYSEGSYGRRGVPGSGRGRYRDGYSEGYGNYGRRGNYRGEEMMDDMYQAYGDYNEGREAYSRGNYGAKEDSMKSLKYMLKAMEDFGMYLIEDASSEEEKNLIRQTMKKMSEK